MSCTSLADVVRQDGPAGNASRRLKQQFHSADKHSNAATLPCCLPLHPSPPSSSFVPYPVTPLHRVDATIKQLWLVALYVLIARATPGMRVGIAAAIALLTATSLPSRLWRAQLNRLALICALIFVFTAIGSDGVPPLLQPRALPDVLEGFAAGEGMLVPEEPYSYVVLHVGFLTITRRSINLAITAAALTFSALQAASLCLITTPGAGSHGVPAWLLASSAWGFGCIAR